ncbi:hypothetical protein Avbf_00828 [Armadillidium vulgare]|nr:hypothetical protein Avbf_00828 [Armadillidium vulgare]
MLRSAYWFSIFFLTSLALEIFFGSTVSSFVVIAFCIRSIISVACLIISPVDFFAQTATVSSKELVSSFIIIPIGKNEVEELSLQSIVSLPAEL